MQRLSTMNNFSVLYTYKLTGTNVFILNTMYFNNRQLAQTGDLRQIMYCVSGHREFKKKKKEKKLIRNTSEYRPHP